MQSKRISQVDTLRISLSLGLLICFLLRFSFHSLLLGPKGFLSSSSASFAILYSALFCCLAASLAGIRKKIVSWLTFLVFFATIHLLSNPTFPAYLSLNAEVYFFWPLLFLACQQSHLFESGRWFRTGFIVYVVYLYYLPLFGRLLYPSGWLDGSIIQITLHEMTPQPSGWKEFLLEHPALMQILSIAALVLETSSVLLFWKTWRSRIAWLLVGFHVVIGMTTFVVNHSVLMISLLIPIAMDQSDT